MAEFAHCAQAVCTAVLGLEESHVNTPELLLISVYDVVLLL
jgi:hypothetical protein